MSPPKKATNAPARGKFSEGRIEWVQLFNNIELILYKNPQAEDVEDAEPGDNVYISFLKLGTQARFILPMSNWTIEELEAFKTFITDAIATARPVIELRDAEAARKLEEEDDDTASRLYRAIPRVFKKKRASAEHGDLVRQRPNWASTVDKELLRGGAAGPDPDA